MKKTTAALTVGLLLIAGQAAGQNSGAGSRVGDRLGAQAGDASRFEGAPLVPALAVIALIIAGVVAAADDDSDSD